MVLPIPPFVGPLSQWFLPTMGSMFRTAWDLELLLLGLPPIPNTGLRRAQPGGQEQKGAMTVLHGAEDRF